MSISKILLGPFLGPFFLKNETELTPRLVHCKVLQNARQSAIATARLRFASVNIIAAFSQLITRFHTLEPVLCACFIRKLCLDSSLARQNNIYSLSLCLGLVASLTTLCGKSIFLIQGGAGGRGPGLG